MPTARMRAAHLVAAWALLGHLGGVREAAGQIPRELHAGRFEIHVDGQRAAMEVFAIRRQGAGRMAVGRVIAELPGVATSFEVGLEVDSKLRPVRYELRPRDHSTVGIVGTLGGGRFRLVVSGAEGERLKEFLATDDLLIVERSVAHHYFFVAERALEASRDGSPRVVEALSPLDARQVTVVLRGVRNDTIRIGEAERPARRIDLVFGEEPRSVWVGPAGEVLRVEIPSRGWSAIRQPQE
ncbi:MAG: hypothetical protein ACE5JR_12005 [Gemmatimonadota bacterium]